MPLPWLGDDPALFPPTRTALREPDGLLAAGGDLSVIRLLNAYSRGIFPWYDEGQPILWWSPDPRLVLRPGSEHCSRSMRKFLRHIPWTITLDRRFEQVIQACAAPRPGAAGTWITPAMQGAYCRLHDAGFAHSIEINDARDNLVGGLYGVSIGRVFFGESMFSRERNASKVAFITLSRWLNREGFALLDCQVSNPHLLTLGAEVIPRATFETLLRLHVDPALLDSGQAIWQSASGKAVTCDGHLVP